MAATEEGLQQIAAILTTFVQDWYDSLDNPAAAQERTLNRFLEGFARTRYGREHGAGSITTIADYRRAFPDRTYDDYWPILERVYAGELDELLYEPPVGIALTRGTSTGSSKLIPMTPADLKTRPAAARAVINYVLQTRQFNLLEGVTLNLAFPSVLRKMMVGSQEVDVGYSSGIYVKHVGARTPVRTLPRQESIDALGGDTEQWAWEKRFALAYEQAKDEKVTVFGGVSKTALEFGKWMNKARGCRPKDVWPVRLLTLGSEPGINTKLAPALRANWGREVAIREIYGATEGMFGQQIDDRRAWTPNYDLFFLEVQVGGRVKMLHEMRPGEIGSLIVSTVIFPRYRIKDLILALDPPRYYRTIGREAPWTRLRYLWDSLIDF
jgi:hypothetical protein